MASVSSLKMKSYAPVPLRNRDLKRWYSGTVLILALVSFGSISRYTTGEFSAYTAVLSIGAAFLLWCLHLESGSLRWRWACPLAVMLAGQLLPTILQQSAIPGTAWFDALGCGLFVYAMVWVTAIHEREPGLQSVATLALLLSLGVLSKPAVAIACALLAAGLFFGSRRKFGGLLGAALLLFTPAILCYLAMVVVNYLTSGAANGIISHSGKDISNSGILLLIQSAPALWFSLAVLISRAVERKLGISDLSYLLVVAFTATAGVASWMPNALAANDFLMIVYAGAGCLLALNPPNKILCRAIVLLGAVIPLFGRIPL